MTDISRILNAIESREAAPAAELLPLVYDELRRLAKAQMANERPGQTLDATGLVHEAYLRLLGPAGDAAFANRRHFFAAAAEAMRRILVENARRKKSEKRGGAFQRVELPDHPAPAEVEDLLALDEALATLAREDALAAKVIEMHYFAGSRHADVAAALGITIYQARQKWTYGRAWLRDALQR
jgi:RNA polymerase sigma factor (TIGR02999 family)